MVRQFLANNKVNYALDSAIRIPGVNAGNALLIRGYREATLIQFSGDGVGSPAPIDSVPTIEESSDGATGWATVTGISLSGITAVSALKTEDFSLAPVKKPYIRVSSNLGLGSGTSLELGMVLALHQKGTLPV